MSDFAAMRDQAEACGQGHIFAFWNELDEAARAAFLLQLKQVDFALARRLAESLHGSTDAAPAATGLQPAEVIRLPQGPEPAERQAAREAGEAAFRAGRMGCFLVAGGQGTRLGYDGPKGCYEVGPISKRSLFQIHAEKVAKLRSLYSARVPWVIMTSDANDASTRAYFAEKDYFGLGSETVRFCKQDSLPAFDLVGKLLLQAKDSLALSPNGHGGSLKALWDSGATKWLKEQGVDTLSYFQVDNCLVKIGDPVFVGYHLQAGAEMSSKVVRKRDWREKVGVVGYLNGNLSVIEYSDLHEGVAQETLADGSLKWWAGSIAIHLLNVDFVERLNAGGFQLPYHLARKRVPCLDAQGRPLHLPLSEKNGVKFETFIFDALPQARASITLETARAADFAPVKNAEGEDSPASARAMMTAEYARWLEAAGQRVPRLADGGPDCVLEISPLPSLAGEGLEATVLPEGRGWQAKL